MLSEAGWIGLLAILVTVALAVCTGVAALIGVMLRSEWQNMKHRLAVLEARDRNKGERMVWLESHLERKGIVPQMPPKDPSPRIHIEENAG